MKVGEIKVTPKELLEKLEKMSKTQWTSLDLLSYNIGTEENPAKNIIRPVGNVESCRVHYLQDFISEDVGIQRVPVCVENRCPICIARKELYKIGTEEAKDKAGQMGSAERNYWNVIPRQTDYDWGDKGKRCVVLSFGKTAREALMNVVTEHGHPGLVREGFDIVFEVAKAGRGQWGNRYKMYGLKTEEEAIVKGETVMVPLVNPSPLTEQEKGYEMVELAQYIEPPTSEVLEKYADIFEVTISTKNEKHREEVSKNEIENHEVIDVDDKKDEIEDRLCFGDMDIFSVKDPECRGCESFIDCRTKIRKKKREGKE